MAKIGQVGVASYLPGELQSGKKDKKRLDKSSSTKRAVFHSLIEAGESDSEKMMIESARLDSLNDPAALEELIDHLFESGENLKRSPVEENLEEYKKNIRILINYVSNKSYDVVRTKGIKNPRTFKQKEFVNIEIIDKKLDSLAVYILSRQKNQMEILRAVDEINGLVINVVR